MRTILRAAVGVVLLFGVAPTAQGQGQEGRGQAFPSAAGGMLQTAEGILLGIQNRGGNKILWNYKGRYGVAGTPGEPFGVYIYNPGPGTRKFVLTLDGVNVIDGSRGSTRGAGYLLRPGQAQVVRGWRDGAYYREFVFDWKGRDVATLLGQGGNQGTLGLAVWDGRMAGGGPAVVDAVPRYRDAAPASEGAAPAREGAEPAREGAEPVYEEESYPSQAEEGGYGAGQPSPNDLGVGQGARVREPVRRVNFQETELVARMSLFYATRNALVHVGARQVRGGQPRPPVYPDYPDEYPDERVPPVSPPPVREPWGGDPFPDDGPAVFRN